MFLLIVYVAVFVAAGVMVFAMFDKRGNPFRVNPAAWFFFSLAVSPMLGALTFLGLCWLFNI